MKQTERVKTTDDAVFLRISLNPGSKATAWRAAEPPSSAKASRKQRALGVWASGCLSGSDGVRNHCQGHSLQERRASYRGQAGFSTYRVRLKNHITKKGSSSSKNIKLTCLGSGTMSDIFLLFLAFKFFYNEYVMRILHL